MRTCNPRGETADSQHDIPEDGGFVGEGLLAAVASFEDEKPRSLLSVVALYAPDGLSKDGANAWVSGGPRAGLGDLHSADGDDHQTTVTGGGASRAISAMMRSLAIW